MPVETGKGSMLCAFVLQKQWALLGPELLQISRIKMKRHGQKRHTSAPHTTPNWCKQSSHVKLRSKFGAVVVVVTLRSFLYATIPQQNQPLRHILHDKPPFQKL